MKNMDEGFWWTALALVVAVGIAGAILAVRLTPDASVECVKVGGTWVGGGEGHCERVGK